MMPHRPTLSARSITFALAAATAATVATLILVAVGALPAGAAAVAVVASGSGAASPVASGPTPAPAPVASFTVVPAPAGSPSRFDASASTTALGTITNFDWVFGDGASAPTNAGATITHAYATSGPFTASLTVTDSAGSTATTTLTLPASVPVVPTTTTPVPATPPVASTTPPTGAAVPATARAAAVPGILDFAGYPWTVRSSTSPIGPGPNLFDAKGPFVDASGALHLRIVKTPAGWQSSEVILNPSFGYGTYRWALQGPVASLDPNVVLGLVIYDDSTTAPFNRELDFEASLFTFLTGPTNAQYVVQPYYSPGNLQRITLPKAAVTIVSLTWTPGSVAFTGETVKGNGKATALQSWTNTSSSVPDLGTQRVHMNLWLNQGFAPEDGRPVTIKVTGFQFSPAP